MSDEQLAKLAFIEHLKVSQLTPLRVLHRRSLLDRPKVIHNLRAQRINQRFFLLWLQTSAGTYVKEFVHGDLGRTTPSLGEMLVRIRMSLSHCRLHGLGPVGMHSTQSGFTTSMCPQEHAGVTQTPSLVAAPPYPLYPTHALAIHVVSLSSPLPRIVLHATTGPGRGHHAARCGELAYGGRSRCRR